MNARNIFRLIVAICLIADISAFTPARSKRLKNIPDGSWGGPHISVQVANSSATIEYDCANGTIRGPLKVDSRGRFNLPGTHVREHGGPIRSDENRTARPARYTGWTDGQRLTLTVTLTDKNETIGTFNLKRGSEGRVFKCR